MNLHEYQSKRVFADYGLPVSRGIAADTPDEAVTAAQNIGGERWVCKVQVHAGGRGKSGGVKVVDSLEAVRKFSEMWLGERLVSAQTDTSGQPVSKIYIEECVDISNEFYLGAVIDRSSRRVVIMASTEGGVEIEKVARESPEKILRATIDPLRGAQTPQATEMARKLGLDGIQVDKFSNIFIGLVDLFHELDCSLVEVNPLVLTKKGNQSSAKFDQNMRDVVNFLHYASEPKKQARISLGFWVLGVIVVLLILLVLLKREYWKDVE